MVARALKPASRLLSDEQHPRFSFRQKFPALIGICAMSLILILGTFLPGTAAAQAPTYKVGVKDLKFSNTKPKPGETVTVTMTIVTTGRGKKAVPWEILVNNKRIGAGVQRNVTAGRSFSVRARWRATPGTNNFLAKADPRNVFKEKGRDRYDNARGQSVRVAANASKPALRGKTGTATRSGAGSRSGKPATAITVKVKTFSIAPSPPKYTDNANLRLVFQVKGTGSADVEWVLKRGNATLQRGVQRNAKASQSYTINKRWRANFGKHKFAAALDPNRKLGEPSNMRSDNIKFLDVTVQPPNWGKCGDGAFSGAVQAVRTWQTQARFRNIKVNSAVAISPPGVLTGPSLDNLIKAGMIAEQCPQAIVDKFASAVAGAWRDWQNGVRVPGLPWYPSFIAFPGPQAPPTPNVPIPLSALPSSGLNKLKANGLEAELNAKLSGVRNQPGAQAAIKKFANQFGARFIVWRNSQFVTNVLGKGRVPNFAPPLVPIGPVVNGSASSAPGAALRAKPF